MNDVPNTRRITEACYIKIKELYVEKFFFGYSFPCGYIESQPCGSGLSTEVIAYRMMDVPVPPEIDELWEYMD